jgi:hypothetical protein
MRVPSSEINTGAHQIIAAVGHARLTIQYVGFI